MIDLTANEICFRELFTEPTAIFTDFKQAVDTIPTWDTLPYSVKSRTIDRDVYQAISNTLHEERATAGFMGTELDLIIRHIYAHATDDTPVSEQRQANIDQQANNYTRVTYSAMQKGNKTADMLAQLPAKTRPSIIVENAAGLLRLLEQTR